MSKLERWSFASSFIYGGTEQIQEAAVAVRAVKGWINFLGSSLESTAAVAKPQLTIPPFP
jgi:hypothetical protein